MTQHYAVTLALQNRLCVVVGGGEVAERKACSLVECEARVRIVAPTVTERIATLADEGRVEVALRRYQPGDLANAFLVIAATDEDAVNEAAWREATARGILVNVVDDPRRCTFFVPASVRRGPFTLAVSTGGASPALAKAVRERLEVEFGPEYGTFAVLLAELRDRVKKTYDGRSDREKIWQALVHSDVLDILREGDEARARERMAEILDRGA